MSLVFMLWDGPVLADINYLIPLTCLARVPTPARSALADVIRTVVDAGPTVLARVADARINSCKDQNGRQNEVQVVILVPSSFVDCSMHLVC